LTLAQATPLVSQLAAQIMDMVRTDNLPAGSRLVERKLAEQLRVSRSPVRQALRLLEIEGCVGSVEAGGYVVVEVRRDAEPLAAPTAPEDEVYHRIAEDRLSGSLPDKVTEKSFMRRYDLTQAQLSKILRRIANEGWIERLPGHGWEFLPMLTSMEAYQDSYRFRLLIEPAAILEPRFVLNRSELERCRLQQQELVDGLIWDVSKSDLFDMNARLHEAVIECSQNRFFIDGLKRIDKLRRLIEYKQSLDRKYAIVRCQEHVQLIDLLLSDKRQEASDFMRRHLASVSIEKTILKKDITANQAA
jgi:DNA-binding GntR family transcriptional regulator